MNNNLVFTCPFCGLPNDGRFTSPPPAIDPDIIACYWCGLAFNRSMLEQPEAKPS